MPSKKQYDLVQNDDYDTRIPLHPEEAFHHGITFQAKYIGMLDVPRPTTRVEIVAAMRRIRYEFKAKGIKKKKVTIEVSVDGVKVTLRKKKKRKHWNEDGKSTLLSHPIYRIFYVSHDSQDLKIFSYISRDGSSNVFKCAVFKSNKKSQAMRVVRTIGQAFEVCHKLSINAPENEAVDQDEQDTLTQDLLSDHLSDIISDRPKRDLISEVGSDKASLPADDVSLKDSIPETNKNKNHTRPPPLDILPPPPPNSNTRRTPLTSAETYASPLSDGLNSCGGSGGSSSLPPPGSALSAHHEIQLLREQLDQQSQQTQAAMAQLQLAREQLAAEQSARMEAQARTHQLLVHNRELLDHIAALVAHLQVGEKASSQQSQPQVTMPQQPLYDNYVVDPSPPEAALLDDSSTMQALGLNPQGLIENRAATSCLPTSPLRTSFNPGYGFMYPPPQVETGYEAQAQILQQIQAMNGGYSPSSTFPFNYNHALQQMGMYNPQLFNNNYTLQQPPPPPPPPQQKKFTQPSPISVRHSYPGGDLRSRHSEPRQLPQYQTNYQTLYQPQSHQNIPQQISQTQQQNLMNNNTNNNNNIRLQIPGQVNQTAMQQQQENKMHQQFQQAKQTNRQTHTQQQNQQNVNTNSNVAHQAATGQQQQNLHLQGHLPTSEPQLQPDLSEGHFIKPLSQMGTLTTTDADGRVRVLVPVPSNSSDEQAGAMLANLRLSDELRVPNGPGITRSTSEKVPNRSEIMSQMQRTLWARHTTK